MLREKILFEPQQNLMYLKKQFLLNNYCFKTVKTNTSRIT